MESVTWAQLGIHDKPCGILNVDGFFDDLLAFVRHAVDQGFIKARQLEALVISDEVDALLDALGSRHEDAGRLARGRRLRPDPGRSRTSRSSSVSPQSARSSATEAIRLLRAGCLLQDRRRVAQVLEVPEVVRHRGARHATEHLVLELRGHDGAVALDDPRGPPHDPALRPLDVHLQEPDRPVDEIVQREGGHHRARVGQELAVRRSGLRWSRRASSSTPILVAVSAATGSSCDVGRSPFSRSEDSRRRQFSEFGSSATTRPDGPDQPGGQERVVAEVGADVDHRHPARAVALEHGGEVRLVRGPRAVLASRRRRRRRRTAPRHRRVQRTASASASCTVNAVGATWCSIGPEHPADRRDAGKVARGGLVDRRAEVLGQRRVEQTRRAGRR